VPAAPRVAGFFIQLTFVPGRSGASPRLQFEALGFDPGVCLGEGIGLISGGGCIGDVDVWWIHGRLGDHPTPDRVVGIADEAGVDEYFATILVDVVGTGELIGTTHVPQDNSCSDVAKKGVERAVGA
jgi:hypothetical protein